MSIYITGGTGQIGVRLRSALSLAALPVVVLSRNKPLLFKNESFIKYELGDSLANSISSKNTTLIHLAHDFTDRNYDVENVNILALQKLVNTPISRFIFLATPTPRGDKPSVYQRQKALCETILQNKNSLVIKPSFIYSEGEGVNKIFFLLKKLRIPIPLPYNMNKLSPIRLDAMIKLIMNMGVLKWQPGTFIVKGEMDMDLKTFLKDFHSIRSFYLPKFFTKWLIYFLSCIKTHKMFYLQERVIGVVNLEDISILTKQEEVKII